MEKANLYKKINSEVSTWGAAFALIVVVGGVVASSFNIVVAYKLDPLTQGIVSVTASSSENKENIQDHELRIRESEKSLAVLKSNIENINANLDNLTKFFLPNIK